MASNVKLSIYNSLGEVIKILINESLSAGNYSINFNGKDLSSGFYLSVLQYGAKIVSRKMLLIK